MLKFKRGTANATHIRDLRSQPDVLKPHSPLRPGVAWNSDVDQGPELANISAVELSLLPVAEPAAFKGGKRKSVPRRAFYGVVACMPLPMVKRIDVLLWEESDHLIVLKCTDNNDVDDMVRTFFLQASI
jgi:hypothetical protein